MKRNSGEIPRVEVDMESAIRQFETRYTEEDAFVLPRAAIQNSIDAKAKKIIFSVFEAKEKVIFTVEDNGVGMGEKDIGKYFLTLFASSKTNGNNIGGFGVEAFMFLKYKWFLHTKQYYCNYKYIGKRPIDYVTKRKGMRLSIVLETNGDGKKTVEGLIEELTKIVKYSSLETKISIRYKKADWKQKPMPQINFDVSKYDEEQGWNYIKTQSTYGRSKILLEQDIGVCTIKVYKRKGYIGVAPVRLGGLVQFFDNYAQVNEFDILIDVPNTCQPDSDEYPLNPTRDALRYNIARKVAAIVNSIRSAKDMIARQSNEFEVKDWYQAKDVVREQGIDYTPIIIKKPAIKKNVQIGDLDSDRYYKLLRIWSGMVNVVNELGIGKQRFGVGFDLTKGTNASHYKREENGVVYLLINPSSKQTGVSTRKPERGKSLYKLLRILSHELTHEWCDYHDDKFVRTEATMFVKLIDNIQKFREAVLKIF